MATNLRTFAGGTAALLALGGLTTLATACGDDTRAAPTVGVSVSDAKFDVPTTIAPGLADLKLSVTGSKPHQMQLLRVNDGATPDQVLAAAANPDPSGLFALVSVAGGVNAVAPGGSAAATVSLSPGTYVAFDFTSPQTAPGVFTVGGVASKAPAPKAKGTVELVDFGFGLPPTLTKGETVEVVNHGKQPHEFGLYRLPDGTTKDDLVHAMHAGQQPQMTPVGGLGAINPGQTGYVTLDLEPGTYAAMCFVPDAATGKAHAEMGMLATFTVG